MKLTKPELQKIIKEEIDRFLDEDLTASGAVPGDPEGQQPVERIAADEPASPRVINLTKRLYRVEQAFKQFGDNQPLDQLFPELIRRISALEKALKGQQ